MVEKTFWAGKSDLFRDLLSMRNLTHAMSSLPSEGRTRMDTSELLDEFRTVRLLPLKHGQWDEEDVLEKEERIGKFILHLENYLFQHGWRTKEKGGKSRTYVSKRDPDTYIELRYSITYPDTRTCYRVELQLKGKRVLFGKVAAEGEMVFSRIEASNRPILTASSTRSKEP